MKCLYRGLWAVLLMGMSARAGSPTTLDRTVYAMGTTLEIHAVGASEILGPASERAVREVERIETACSTWRETSEWSHLNQARGQPVVLAPEWIDLLSSALTWQKKTGGAFDPVLGALMRAWGIRQGGRQPTVDELAQARADSGAALLSLDPPHRTARLRAGAAIEEGGFVKGYALDRARAMLVACGVASGYLNFGGQILAWGTPRRVEVSDRLDRQRARLSIALDNASLSSSGTAEHGRHILDPLSGERCPAWGSTSVVMRDGLSADVLSTALYVMGPERGLAWAEANQVPALLQPNQGPPLMTTWLKALRPERVDQEQP